VLGVASIGDLIKWLASEQEVEHLQNYISSTRSATGTKKIRRESFTSSSSVLASAHESLGSVLDGRIKVQVLSLILQAPDIYCVSGFLMIGVFCSMLPGTNSVFTSVS
jgi:hypothetical protein